MFARMPLRQLWKTLSVARSYHVSSASICSKHVAYVTQRSSAGQHRFHNHLHRFQHSQSAVQSHQRARHQHEHDLESEATSSSSNSCSWNTLTTILDQKLYKRLVAIGRLPQVEQKYKQHKQNVNESHGSAGDYIKERYLSHIYNEHHQLRTDSQPQVSPPPNRISNPDIDEPINNPKLRELLNMTRMTPNEFPYNFTSDVQHDVLWSGRPLSDNEIQQLVEYYKPSTEWETRYFVNPPEWKSIPEVEHVQIFSRKKQQ